MLRKTSVVISLGILMPLGAMASGPWLPERLLMNGGEKILDAPEFFFELEMKQLATHYPTPFEAFPEDKEKPGSPAPAQTNEAKLYARGAEAYKAGRPDEARSAWKELLALPEGERRSLSTSAVYMLGRINIDRPLTPADAENAEAQPSDSPSAEQPRTPQDQARDEEAVAYFKQVRELVQKGFADPDGLAAASLGWEAYVELHRAAFHKAATLYLQQLAAGDLRAVDSLKAVAVKLTDEAVSDPLLRRIRTAEILCYRLACFGYYTPSAQGTSDAVTESAKWLAAVEKTGAERIEEAERLGWMAYCVGDYKQAERWLKRADPETGLALWLQAKLLMREGKVAEAAGAMSKAIRKIPTDETRNAEAGYYYGQIMPSKVAAGDMGMLLLARSDFTSAFHAFLQGNHWEDAAYVAERVLTAGELQKIVDREFKAIPSDDKQPVSNPESYWYERRITPDHRIELRWLLGRRLVRLGKFTEARPYLPVEFREVLDRYADALKQADNKKAKPEDRAKALFDAALIARRKGMELMGTEVEPDGTLYDGMFPAEEVRAERLKGEYTRHLYNPDKTEIRKTVLPVSAAEHDRLTRNKVEPEKRFHYRYKAAELAWQAAKLLPDNSELTADVLNAAGTWLKDRDEEAADPFLQAIERRCQNTEIGRAVLKKHWFVEQKGPWSGTAEAPQP